jgi:hypothetical protein
MNVSIDTGNPLMWQAIRSAADALLYGDLRLADAILKVHLSTTYIHTYIHILEE